MAADLLYDGGRWIGKGNAATADAHSHWIAGVERSLGIGVEASVQHALSSSFWTAFLGNVYLVAQLAVLPLALWWLYRRGPEIYTHLRSTILATWAIAVPIFALFPVAPPRLADVGVVDTVSQQTPLTLTGHSTLFYNPLAAVPSLHVGFAFAVALGLAASLRSRLARGFVLLWAPLVTLSVIATGNHYVFDAVAGLGVTAVGFATGELSLRGARREIALVGRPRTPKR